MKGLLLICLIMSTYAYSQDRGCHAMGSVGVSHGMNQSGYDSIYYYSYAGFLGAFGNSNDTIVVELVDTSDVQIGFNWDDEYWLNYYSEVEWYRNDTLIDPSMYEFTFNNDGYSCNSSNKTKTNLSTKIPGVYHCKNGYFNGQIWVEISIPHVEIRLPAEDESDSVIEPSIYSVFPNPVDDILTIQHSDEGGQVEIYDFQGKLIRSYILEVDSDYSTIDVSNLSSGTYLFQIFEGDGTSYTQKVIIF